MRYGTCDGFLPFEGVGGAVDAHAVESNLNSKGLKKTDTMAN